MNDREKIIQYAKIMRASADKILDILEGSNESFDAAQVAPDRGGRRGVLICVWTGGLPVRRQRSIKSPGRWAVRRRPGANLFA